ncbi:MAG: alpha-galactosidase [Eubacterium sp.]
MKFFIAILVILLIAAASFGIWFAVYRSRGKCPICALQKITKPTKVTIDTDSEEPYSNGAALTPPMGWSSWNTFRQNISEDLILSTAEAMKKTGLLEAGYQYINLDDCWQSSLRDANGRLQGDLEKFPNGIPHLISQINQMGMKVGLYTSNGTATCEDLPASLGKEVLDAQTFAEWGCEFFKYDFCHHKIISGEAPIIEAIEISAPGSKAELTLYPEDAELSGRARVLNIKRLPSGKGIGLLNHGAGTATFRPVVNFDGQYVLTLLIYKQFARREKYLQVIVNGETYEVFFPTSNGFSATGRTQLIVRLKGGANEIILRNPIATAADSSYVQYRRMGKALKDATRRVSLERGTREKPIVFSLCEWGTAHPWHWGAKAGNMWRTTHDITAKWTVINYIYERTLRLYQHAGPGAWNDPDMLEVGNGKLTDDENKTHFSLWCMLAAPLILGNDLRLMLSSDGEANPDNPVLKTVTNKSLILIDQDPLGKPAKRIKKMHGIDIIARPLANGDIALCFYNAGSHVKGLSFDINELSTDDYLNFNAPAASYQVHELWSDERFAAKTISVSLQKHACKVFRISI